MYGLPAYPGGVWAADFEYQIEDGGLPVPLCAVLTDIQTGRTLRLWQDQLHHGQPPIPLDASALYISYNTPAEFSCHLALGWPLPERALDLYAEFLAETNKLERPAGAGLLGALAWHNLPGTSKEYKTEMQQRALQGGPWTDDEREVMLDYCATDVVVLPELLERMIGRITATKQGLAQALFRGRAMRAVAHMDRTGIPVDTDRLQLLRDRWADVRDRFVKDSDSAAGIYDDGSWADGRFLSWLVREGIPEWPRLPSGGLDLKDRTFKDMAAVYPQVGPVRELRRTLSDMKNFRLPVGPDGRHRAPLFPFRATTGRNLPRDWVFGRAKWLRGLIRPEPGMAIAYLDYSAQEIAVAAALSGDPALIDTYLSGDPYMAFAVRAGLAPPGATKDTHPDVRKLCKTAFLATNYGQGAASLSERTGLLPVFASEVLWRMRDAYRLHAAWVNGMVQTARFNGRLITPLGWQVHTETQNVPALKNWMLQATGADMTRLATCLVTERGVRLCTSVHDALLIEAPTSEIDDTVAVARSAMREASAAVLGGMEVRTDAKIFRHPDRYMESDNDVRDMWDRVMRLIMVEP